jgi:hypothetical protein
MVTWERTPLGLETAAPCQPRAALAAEGSEKRWNLRERKVPALHREAERDTTGILAVSPSYIRGLRPTCKGGVAARQHSALIRVKTLKRQLTLWFYCGKRAPRRHGFVGEPRKSLCFAGVCIPVRCSIFMPLSLGVGTVTRPDRRLEFSGRLRRAPRRGCQANPFCSRPR